MRRPSHYVWPLILSVAIAVCAALIAWRVFS